VAETPDTATREVVLSSSARRLIPSRLFLGVVSRSILLLMFPLFANYAAKAEWQTSLPLASGDRQFD
jgi:hypothetical protein